MECFPSSLFNLTLNFSALADESFINTFADASKLSFLLQKEGKRLHPLIPHKNKQVNMLSFHQNCLFCLQLKKKDTSKFTFRV